MRRHLSLREHLPAVPVRENCQLRGAPYISPRTWRNIPPHLYKVGRCDSSPRPCLGRQVLSCLRIFREKVKAGCLPVLRASINKITTANTPGDRSHHSTAEVAHSEQKKSCDAAQLFVVRLEQMDLRQLCQAYSGVLEVRSLTRSHFVLAGHPAAPVALVGNQQGIRLL